MKFIILAMSISTAEWSILWPEIFNWNNQNDCEIFIENNLIRKPDFIYSCAEDHRKLTTQPEDV